ncbi:MAG: DNA repair protein RadC [Akkermansia sp.]
MKDDGAPEPLQLRDMNARDLPRERLMRLGRSALSDEELIAIFLRTGLHGCNVLELAAQLKRAAGGSLAALGRLDGAELARLCKGIGAAKAATLAAVFELGQRAVRERLEQTKLETPETVYEMLAGELRYEPVENLILLLLDVRRHLLRRVHLGRGTLTQVITHPRNVFREALLANASSFIMVHNHPSGDPTPSKADEKLTNAIAQAGDVMGIRLMDHIIIGAPRGDAPAYYSFRQHSRIP